MPWIHHPALDEPVSWKRWFLFKLSEYLDQTSWRLKDLSNELEHRALYQESRPDDQIPF